MRSISCYDDDARIGFELDSLDLGLLVVIHDMLLAM